MITTRPISYNFKVTWSNLDDDNFFTDRSIIYVQHFGGGDNGQFLEVDGNSCKLLICHILLPKVTISYLDAEPLRSNNKESFLIGLSKLQYDFLYSSSAFPTKAKSTK